MGAEALKRHGKRHFFIFDYAYYATPSLLIELQALEVFCGQKIVTHH